MPALVAGIPTLMALSQLKISLSENLGMAGTSPAMTAEKCRPRNDDQALMV
jgi:hypothetical protein